jgi:hypothetical protein
LSETAPLSGNPKKKVNVEHYCFEDKLRQFEKLEDKIKDLLAAGKSVPDTLLKQYFELLSAPAANTDAEITVKAKDTKQKAIAFFAAKKQYQFEKKVKVSGRHPFGWDGADSERVYSLADMIRGTCDLLESYLQLLGGDTKEIIITQTYHWLKQYLSEIPGRPVLTPYQVLVITGFITAYFGYNLTEEQFNNDSRKLGPYTLFLANSVRHLAKKAQNKPL